MSPFNWRDGRPSIFATPSALRYAKASATNAANQAKASPKPKVEPVIRKRRPVKV